MNTRCREWRASWLLLCVSAACGGTAEDPAGGSTTGVAASTTCAAGDNGAPRLCDQHPGWKQPRCLSCHGVSVKLPHDGDGYEPPVCVGCHGYNGAPHVDHAGDPLASCAECHTKGAVVSDHIGEFDIPIDCAACHLHPESPDGT